MNILISSAIMIIGLISTINIIIIEITPSNYIRLAEIVWWTFIILLLVSANERLNKVY